MSRQEPSKCGPAERRYGQLEKDREPFLIRARACSALTIPSLFREAGADGSSELILPWQSFGAYCVNTISSKLTLTMFPPGISPIRLDPSKKVLDDLTQLGDDIQKGLLKGEINKGLRQAELEFTSGVEQDDDATVFGTGHRYLIVGGNHAYQRYSDGTYRGITLDNFVVVRDGQGNVLEAIIRDDLVFETLPEPVKMHLRENLSDDDLQKGQEERKVDSTKVCLYTHIFRRDGQYETYQECMGLTIPDTEWTWAPDYLPFMFVPFDLLPGENYGRSYVEYYLGDLQSLEGLEQTVQEGAAAAAKFIRLVRPGGVTSKEALAKAINGDIITGIEADVYTLEAGKTADFQTAENRIGAREARLSRAFLLNSAVQRSGERVTAEEIKYVAQELNDALGNLYLAFLKSEQKPYARLKVAAMMRDKRMTPLPKDTVNVKIATGAAALSRNAELAALDAFSMPASPVAQQASASIINWTTFFMRRAISQGIDQDNLVYSEDEQAQKAAAQMQQQQMLDATGPLVQQGGSLMKAGLDQQAKLIQSQMEQDQAKQPQQSQPQ